MVGFCYNSFTTVSGYVWVTLHGYIHLTKFWLQDVCTSTRHYVLIEVQNGRKQSFSQMTEVKNDWIQFSSTMMFSVFVRYMLQLRQGVKNTPAHVHESCSCWYNISVHSVYISWHVTFGLHAGPLSDTVKSTADGLQLLRVQERSCTLDFNMVAEQWSWTIQDRVSSKKHRQQSCSIEWRTYNNKQWQQLQLEETSTRCTGTSYHHHSLQESTQHSKNGNTSL